ncbi:MAG: DUF402 domain-containing protein [Lachnospiraceae bacterium]|nr:DUF402 domain-containing protein [Lachnospiraceae bacterium]
MTNPILYRRRIIPDECILLKGDEILSADEDRIVTKWNTLKPRADFHHGYSCYFLKEGFKISRFLREDGSLVYWYCDIVDFDFRKLTNELVVTDLLADVIVCPDGFVKVVDLDELVTALDDGLIDQDILKRALLCLDKLLSIVYAGKFGELTKYLPK